MIQIGHTAEKVSDEPLDHLIACHDRILRRLDILRRVGAALETDASAAMQALRNAIRFFELSGRLHTEDEEESVFPRLRNHVTGDHLAYLDSLESQHREKEAVYAELRELAAELEAGVTPARAQRFRELAARLAGLYESHIASENDVLISLGRTNLGPEELAEIRDEMRARRHVDNAGSS